MVKNLLRLYKQYFWTNEKYAKHIGVKIGKDCSIATIYFGTEPYLIEIGNRVQITNGVRFFNHGAAWVFRKANPKYDIFGKIKIGDNVYVGNNSLIMPGVTIGDNVIIGAGSIVTKSVENGQIVAGNPAKVIGKVDELKKRLEKYNLNTKGMDYIKKRNYLSVLKDDKFLKK